MTAVCFSKLGFGSSSVLTSQPAGGVWESSVSLDKISVLKNNVTLIAPSGTCSCFLFVEPLSFEALKSRAQMVSAVLRTCCVGWGRSVLGMDAV